MSEQLSSLETINSSNQLTALTSTSDPTSSLRAAALLTLKSKRRKPTVENSANQVLPSRPPPLNTGFQLDYGTEDPTTSPSERAAIGPSDPVPASSTSPVAAPAEDVSMREEGEISDEETTTPLPIGKPSLEISNPRTSPRLSSSTAHDRRSTPPNSARPHIDATPPRTRQTDRITDPAFPHGQGVTSSSMVIDAPDVRDSPILLLDADHVRPGLAMTQSQYDTAKDVVLDLLGWGVEPEYLVDCGLTREIVYYVFTELNLRLPPNLDITGIIPYTPDMLTLEHHSSVLMPPPTTTRAKQYSQGSPSKPHSLAQSGATVPVRTEPRPILPETSPSPTTSSLHDMEQQRRQELLARKAAIASRKSKQTPMPSNPSASPLNSSTSSINNSGAEMLVPSETVEDFLKSIGPAAEESSTSIDAESQSRRTSVDAMDVDEIPGLRGAPDHILSPVSERVESEAIIDQSVVSNASESKTHDYPPSSSDSVNTAFTSTSSDTVAMTPDGHNSYRRGTKRPVASDFDLDLGPRVQSNTGGYSNSFVKHKPTGLASISGMRRCVIDLSDSEGEGDEDVTMRDVATLRHRRVRRSGYSSPAPISASVGTPGGWGTPPASALPPGITGAGITASATMSPVALAEKELEIRRMREMIAQRERDRQKKLAASRSIANIETNGTSVSVKEEDLDIGLSSMSVVQGNGTSHLPNGQASPTPSENAVSHGHGATGLALLAEVVSSIPSNSSHKSSIDQDYNNGVVYDIDTDPVTHTITEPQVLTTEAQQEQAMSNPLLEPDVTGEGPQESAEHSTVDVDSTSSSSAQVHRHRQAPLAHPRHDANQDLSVDIPIRQHDEGFTTYDSLFKFYPLLGQSRLAQDCSSSFKTSFSPSSLGSVSSPSSLRASSTFSSFECPSSTTSSSSFFSPSVASAHLPFPFVNLKALRSATVSKLLNPMKPICQYEIPGGGICRDAGCEDVHLNVITGCGGSGEVEPSDQDTAEYLAKTLPVDWIAEHTVSQSKILSTLGQMRAKNPEMDFEARVKEALMTLGAPPPPTPP